MAAAANIEWTVSASDGEARAGLLRTRRSVIETPVFMPVGTQGTVKGVRFEWLEDEIDAKIILGNTYHLWIRPGHELIRELGGLHKFTSWNRSLLTDSGGFQVFSLSDLRSISEDGVEFRSHLDGDKMFMSPEVSMEIQAALGSEIVMVLDECPPGDAGVEATRKSLEMTARWAVRSKKRFVELQGAGTETGFVEPSGIEGGVLSGEQALFGIVQGAGHLDLRAESLKRTAEIGFDGYAIGGLSVGEKKATMYEVIENTAPAMPADAPRYLMGVGTPEDLIESVSRGVDMFDCVMPTRNGRTGGVFTSEGDLNIRNANFAKDESPIDERCPCSVCARYSRAYLRHLYRCKEILAATLISHHNLSFFCGTMTNARSAILAGKFKGYRAEFLERRKEGASGS
ncbi:MAG: tRNA guanosine(34) transglycosylase Tgt [Acidobacteriota bacterium]|nr:tRNA guanosine(34) transglycosylase Tgt [Acidobacteriota bacterium]MDH3528845.1 tRNA guanosine(34) transglycosylase Tgt [Acidobacteriota bacterium]